MQKLKFIENSPERLDKYLSTRLELSRAEIWRLFEQNHISLNNKILNKKHKGRILQIGDEIKISDFKAKEKMLIKPNPKLKIKIIENGKDYLIVNKPASINIIPKSEIETNTVLNALIAKYPQIQGIGEAGLHSGVVHRLDRDTSGILIVAKTEEKWQALRQAFKEHRGKKIYHAIVIGNIAKTGKVEMNLLVSNSKPAKVKVSHKAKKRTWLCDLSWQKLESFKAASLIEVSLGTGFLHQIRVMMAELGHAIIADELYGSSSSLVNRQMLHAKSISVLGIKGIAEYPEDFKSVLDKLELK